MGLALLAKFTAVILPPVIILILLLFLFSREYRAGRARLPRLAAGTVAAILVSLLVLNAGYLFNSTGKTLQETPAAASPGDFSFGDQNNATSTEEIRWRSNAMQSLRKSFLGDVPMPFPILYLHGIDKQLFKSNIPVFTYFLNGKLSAKGWALYYPEAFALKTPIPLLILLIVAAGFMFAGRSSFYERILWLVPVVFMIQFTFFARVDLGLRYLLPIVPFLIVICAGAMSKVIRYGSYAKFAAVALCLWYAGSIFTTFGNGLAYFNEFAGGPGGGHRYLVESNLDWGQNLVRLKMYTENIDASPLLVYNYGLVPPAAYGIKSGWVPCKPEAAVVAISVNYLYGVDPFEKRPRACFKWLRQREPVRIIGDGLFVYDMRKESKD